MPAQLLDQIESALAEQDRTRDLAQDHVLVSSPQRIGNLGDKDKDLGDLRVGLDQGIDHLGLSFVRAAEDVRAARAHIERLGGHERKLVAHGHRHAEGPLADRHVREDAIHEVGSELAHAPAAAGGTNRAPFARELDDGGVSTPLTAHAQQAVGEDAAPEVRLELAPDEHRPPARPVRPRQEGRSPNTWWHWSMKTKVLRDDRERTIALVFETGDQVVDGLLTLAKTQGLTAGHFTAIGAFRDVTLGFFDWETRN